MASKLCGLWYFYVINMNPLIKKSCIKILEILQTFVLYKNNININVCGVMKVNKYAMKMLIDYFRVSRCI